MDYRLLWAKSAPFHPLWCHLLDVGAVCQMLLPRFGSVGPIPPAWLVYIAALHDIGKADPQFQNKEGDRAAEIMAAGIPLPDDVTLFRHEARSALWIESHLKRTWKWDRHAAKVIAQATRGHHGDFAAGSKPDACPDESELPGRQAVWDPLREDLAHVVREALDLKSWSCPPLENISAVGMKLSGLIVLSDWIASNDGVYRYLAKNLLNTGAEPAIYYQQALQEAENAVRGLDLFSEEDVLSATSPSFVKMWPHCVSPRPFQKALERECKAGLPPGIAILEAPMGEGKTEAAIFLARYWNKIAGKSGSYIALPTQATSNQMHMRYEELLRRVDPFSEPPRLVQGMAWLIDADVPDSAPTTYGDNPEQERELAAEWFRNAKRALIATEGVGTVDQALMASLNVRFGFLRSLGLSTKSLIIDEVHSYDTYMTTLLERLLAWCRALEIPVILLSAALAHEQKQRLVTAYTGKPDSLSASPRSDSYPLLTFASLEGAVRLVPSTTDAPRSVSLQCHPGLLPSSNRKKTAVAIRETAELAVQITGKGGCACVVMNTVKAAQDVFTAIQQFKLAGTHLILFHARYRAERRQKIEKLVAELFGKGRKGMDNPRRPRRAILVATQVVESSLDVDFDVMITSLAPIDLLLQRSGRLWRHERGTRPTGNRPTLHILTPPTGSFAEGAAREGDFGPTGKVYLHEPLLRTLALLEGRDSWMLPTDFRPLVEAGYNSDPLPEHIVSNDNFAKAVKQRTETQAYAVTLAERHLIPEPDTEVFQLAEMKHSANEGEEGEANNYFRAQTRLGNDSRNVLVLHDPPLVKIVREGAAAEAAGTVPAPFPAMKDLQKLFLQKASVPGWWLAGLEPEAGFEMLTEVPRWLQRYVVFIMRNGVWKGTQRGKPVLLRDCPDRGLVLEFSADPDRDEDRGDVD